MSNRTVLEFNHDVDWTEDVDGLVKVLNSIRRSAPIGDKEFQESMKVYFGISYIETRHHTTERIDERVEGEVGSAQQDRISELEDELVDAYERISQLEDEKFLNS